MSGNLRDIKDRIKAIGNTASITKAMYNISASKLRSAGNLVENYNDFMVQLNTIFYGTGAIVGNHRLINPKLGLRKVYVLITGDRGLAGGYHSQLFKFLQDDTNQNRGHNSFVIIGKKGFQWAKKENFKLLHSDAIACKDDISLIDIRKISFKIRNMFINNEIDEITICYNRYINGSLNRPRFERVLPIPISTKAIQTRSQTQYLYDSNPVIMLENMSILHVESMIYGAIASAKLAEHSARMIAMMSATDNAQEAIKGLNMIYHRARQQQITNELIDIINGSKV